MESSLLLKNSNIVGRKIAIIGAGISGLTSAHFLKGSNDVTIFEKEERPGGLIKCKRVNGSLFHTCGGHVFNSKYNHVLDWFWSRFDREREFVKTERNSAVFMENGLHVPYPIENHTYMLPDDMVKGMIENAEDITFDID